MRRLAMKKPLWFAVAVALLAASTGLALAGDKDKEEAKGDKLPFEVYTSYFEKNNSGLKGDESFLAFTDRKSFDQVFGVAVVMGKKPSVLAKDAFDSKLVVAAIKRGDAPWTYKVDKVTGDGDTLYIQYDATTKKGDGTAKFASPLIVSVDRGKYKTVVFLENGKKVGTADVPK
jgi:hypothetical protein